MLNPQASGALEVSEIKALYKGEEYVCNENQMTSKAVLPRFYGLKTEKAPSGLVCFASGNSMVHKAT